jgi:uncharacterized protein YkwD
MSYRICQQGSPIDGSALRAEQQTCPSSRAAFASRPRTRWTRAGLVCAALLIILAGGTAHAADQASGREASSTLVLSGTVCARATGAPVAGAQVGAQGHWATAGHDGTYSLTLQPATRLPVRAAALGYQSTDVVTIYNPDESALSGQIGFSFCGNNGLVEAFRDADDTVRLASFQQLQPPTQHTIVITGTSTVALENDPALQLPSGRVTLLSLSRHGKAVSAALPLTAGRGRYVLEINAAAGFALIKLPIFAGIGYTPPPAPAPFTPDRRGASTVQLRVAALDAINRPRTQAGLPPLTMDARLDRASQAHSDDMAAHNFVGHYGSNGSRPDQRVRAAGVRYVETAEDVGTGDSIQAVIEGLMDSPAHRWAILGDFHVIGIGIATAHDNLLMTLDFVR